MPASGPDPRLPFDARRLTALLARLSDPATSLAEAKVLIAELDGHELELALPLFARLREAEHPSELRAVSQLLARWAGRPVARALAPALQTLLQEPEVADLNRMVAAGLLERLGEPVDYPEVLRHMRDLSAVSRAAARQALDALRGPTSLTVLLDEIAGMPLDRVLAFIDDLCALGDRRAAWILGPLGHAANPDVAVSAVAAIETMGLIEADTTLARIAGYHADPGLRRQAQLARERLAAMSVLPAAGPRRAALALEALASPAGASGARLLMLTLTSPDGDDLREAIVFHLEAEAGIGRHVLSEPLDPVQYASLLEALAAGDVALVTIALDEARALLASASEQSLQSASSASVAHIAWLEQLEGAFGPNSDPREGSAA